MLIRPQAVGMDGMRRQYERTLIATEYMRFKVSNIIEQIGLPDVRDYFDQHPNEFQTYDNVQHGKSRH